LFWGGRRTGLEGRRRVFESSDMATFDRSGEKKPASHDSATPPALLSFMRKGWRPAARKLPTPLSAAKVFKARRKALSRHFRGEALFIPTGHEKVRANDTNYRFRPGSDFYYLTGNLEPDCVLALLPEGSGHRHVLFVEPNPGRADATFYTDRAKGELWVGPRLGVQQSRARFGVDECRGLPDLPQLLTRLRGGKVRVLRGHLPSLDGELPESPEADRELATVLSEMRLLKDELELRELSRAVAATHRGFEDVIRGLADTRGEREVEGIFNLRARVEGNDVGYGTIAAAGAHACILHWTRNDGPVRSGDLLLLDAGVEGNSLYTADITRTLPIRGKFNREQRKVYQLVYRAQQAAFAAARPGNDFLEPNRAAMQVLAQGLEALGILPMSAKEALAQENQFYKRYSLHNVSHMLGLDVHDCAKARQEAYKFGKLRPGMVLTIEPGLYFQLDDLTVPAKYRGIGVRIEDDIVITSRGHRNLSRAIPREASEVEDWMARLWRKARKKKR
jgi:Xaa-Pro aminopeptidase